MENYETVFDLCFSVKSGCGDPDEIPLPKILEGLQRRLDYLRENPEEIREAVGICSHEAD